MSRLRLVAVTAIALVLALPGSVLAATVDVSGTVTAPEGVSVAGVEIAVLVQGSDEIISTFTDENGGWALQVEAEAGAVVEINATGQTTSSEPDAEGCITSSTPSGQVEVTLGEIPPAPIEVPMDRAISGITCAETGTPDNGGPVKPAKTPPSTDAAGGIGGGVAGSSLLAVAGLLALMSAISLVVTRRRHTRRLARRPVRRG